MQLNDALAFLRLEATPEDLAVVKSFPHVPAHWQRAQLRLDHFEADRSANPMRKSIE
jgi:hypothetical protein